MYYDLFDIALAIPKRTLTSTQADRLAQARQQYRQLRTCDCGEICPPARFKRAARQSNGQYLASLQVAQMFDLQNRNFY